jgi:dienelactone hydrolase
MKFYILIVFIITFNNSFGQNHTIEEFGFRRFNILFQGDTINILMKSKKGDEQLKKPLFLFCQGSLPQPLCVYEQNKLYSTFPFSTDSLEVYYHIAIISKPYIPLLVSKNLLDQNFIYHDSVTNKIPKKYSDRNLLDYYVNRNIKAIKHLEKLPFIEHSKLVIAGHSEGSTIAAKMALKYKKISHLIYSSGNPFGRIMAMIGQSRSSENDSILQTENEFQYWQQVINNKTSMEDSLGDTYKACYDFSIPPINYLKNIKIPTLISYGTEDVSASFNDYLRVETIRNNKPNFTFKSYLGLEHNYFPMKESGEINYEIFNWDKVGIDWLNWLNR